MKLNLFKKVCLTVMGVGVVSSLVSVGTFATFTATTTNPGNTFAAGTLQITTSAGGSVATANSNVTTAPNADGTGTDFGTATTCTTVVASACGTILSTSAVTLEGIEPGQYVKGHITIANSGTLPAIVSLNVQQLFSYAAGTNGLTTVCPVDISGAGLATNTLASTINALGGCQPLGKAVNITIHDDSAFVLGGSCLFGSKGTGTAAPDAHNIALAGACDDLTLATTGPAGTNLTPGSAVAPVDAFSNGAGSLAALAGTAAATAGTAIYIPGGSAKTNSALAGVSVKYWAPAESHTFTIVVSFPDQGAGSGTITSGAGSDLLTIGRDTVYQGGKVGMDLAWLAQQ